MALTKITNLRGGPGPQGIPGPASPHQGSNIATSLKAFAAVGDGVADDTVKLQNAIAGAGEYGFVDAESGTYKVTGNLGLGFWGRRWSGPGVITDGSVEFRVNPRSYADVNTIWVHGTSGNDANDGISPNRPLETLAGLAAVFERLGSDMERGSWRVRLSGTITGGGRFSYLPRHRVELRFEGDSLDGSGRPTTWIVSQGGSADRFGLRFESGEDMKIALDKIGFRGFNNSSGYGWLMKEGGFIRTTDCWTEDCQIGSGYVGRVGFSEIRSKHRGYTISGTRAQYNASGTWTEVDASGGGSEGFHISRNAVCHVDKCIANDNSRDGVWADMSTRVAVAGTTMLRNAREGVRGEGGAEIHLDDTTYGPNNFGVGTADANVRRGVGKYGNARLTATESIYGVQELVVDRRVGSWTADTQVQSARGVGAERVGDGARLRIKAWGTGGGQLSMALGNTSAGTFDVPQTWMVDLSLQYLDGAWQGYRQISGGGMSVVSFERGPINTIPAVTPRDTCVLRGVEFSTGG